MGGGGPASIEELEALIREESRAHPKRKYNEALAAPVMRSVARSVVIGDNEALRMSEMVDPRLWLDDQDP